MAAPRPSSTPDIYRELDPNVRTGVGFITTLLPRDNAIKRLFIHLRVNLTTPAAGAVWLNHSPQRLLRLIRVSGTLPGASVVTIKEASGQLLYAAAKFKRSMTPWRVMPQAGQQANIIAECTIPIEFYASNMADSGLSFLPAYAYRDLKLELLWGDITDLTASANVTLNSATAEITTHEIPGLVGDFHVNVESSMIFNHGATGNGIQTFDLPLSGLYKSLMFHQHISQGPSDEAVTRFEVNLNGMTAIRRQGWRNAQGVTSYIHDETRPGNTLTFDATSPPPDPILNITDFLTWNRGLVFIDFAQNGGITGLLDARAMTTFRVLNDVAVAPCTMEVLLNRFEQPAV